MEFSAHAMQRCHQRDIRPIQAQWLVDFGIRTWNRGAQVYFFNRASLSRLLDRLAAAERQLAEKAQNAYVVVVDGTVVTVGRRKQAFCVRKPGAHHHRRSPVGRQQHQAA